MGAVGLHPLPDLHPLAGATLKLRRAVVAKMYQVEMRRFYEDHQEG